MSEKYFTFITLCVSILIVPLLTANNGSESVLFLILGLVEIYIACFFIKKIQSKFWMIIPLAFLFSTLSIILFVSLAGTIPGITNDIIHESQAMALWKYLYLGLFGLILCAHVILNIQQYVKGRRYFFMLLHIVIGLFFCFMAFIFWWVNYPIM